MNLEHPVIIIDNREQMPLTFEHFPSRCGTLQSGDYSLAGHEGRFTVERKSVADLIGSLTAGRGTSTGKPDQKMCIRDSLLSEKPFLGKETTR